MDKFDEVMFGGIQAVLAGFSMMLEQIDPDDLAQYVKTIDDQQKHFEAVGWVTDPTAYQKAISGDKEYQSLVIQLEAAKHLLQARLKLQELRDLGGGEQA